MIRTATFASAAVIAASLVVAGPLPHAAAVTETNNVLVTNQYADSTCASTNHQIQIANAFTGALVQDLNSPNTSWQIPNDAKPFDLNRKVVALWGGHSSYSGSNGIGVFDRTTNQWTTQVALSAFERGANGAHSVTVLPDGYFAVALTGMLNGAGSGYVVVVSPTGTITDSEGLASAHGVEWDASRSAVFALGSNDLRKYLYSTTTHLLTQTASYDLPGTNPLGHDLRRRRTDNDYNVTVNTAGHVFDPETGAFTALLKSGGVAIGSGVKSVDQRFDGITEYSYWQGASFNFFDRASKSATFCLSGYKHGRWIYAAGENVYPEDTATPPPPPVSTGIGYGFPMDQVVDVQSAGADLAYGSFWMGEWVNDSGWGGLRTWLDKAIANDVTPVIQWYYWGDEINANCYQTTCGSSKTKANWDTLAGQLRNEIALKMQGRKAIVVLETEWHKHGMESATTFDGWLRNQMTILRSDTTEDIEVALGWGHWASEPAYTTYTQAAQAADYNGTMVLFSCLDDRGEFAGIDGSIQKIIDNATTLTTKYGKPILVDDVGLSTYSGSSSGDSSYSLYSSYDRDCPVSYDYALLQEEKYAEIFTRKAELASAGVFGLVFRSFNDSVNLNGTIQFHKIAERWWGIVRDTGNGPEYKPAYDDVINGIKGENGEVPPPGPIGGSEWSQEAESFTTKPVGGQCTSATASGGLCWNVWSNGTISTTMTAATAGVKTVSVIAHGDPAGGIWPLMKVRVDGVEIMNLAVGTDQWAAYSAAITLTAGTHALAVEYTNDGSVAGNDRNLLVDAAKIDPASRGWLMEAESFTTKTTGGLTPSTTASAGMFWNVWANGYIENGMTVGTTGRHELHVTARGSVAGGVWPIMKVYVDGTLVLTQTVNTATWVTYKVRRTLSGGTRTLRVEFTNDGLVGVEDRNLHVDVASLYT